MAGFSGSAASRPLVAALAALAAVLVLLVAVVVAIVRGGGDRPTPVADEAGTTTAAPPTSPESPRLSMLVPPSSEAAVTGLLEVSGPACDAPVINSDLGFPNSRARILDCGTGWAVLASGVSGAPYWVAYSDGRWRRTPDVSASRGTCQEEAIARGVPEWMARRHLGTCPLPTGPGQGRPGATTPSPSRTSAAPDRPAPPASSTRTRTRTRTTETTDPPASSATTPPQTSVTPPTSETTTDESTSVPAADAPAE